MSNEVRSRPRFAVLGSVRAWRDDDQLTLGSPQQRAILAVFLLSEGTSVTVEQLIDAVWDDDPPEAAVGIIRTYVYRLRQVLGPDVIRSIAGGYVLPLEPEDLDLQRFHQLLARAGGQGDPGRALDDLTEALQLWAGPPLSGLPGRYVAAQRMRLHELRLSAREQRLDLEMHLGLYAEAIAGLSELLAERPTVERTRELLMEALYRSGRQVEALQTFASAREVALRHGLSLGPGIQRLHQRILAADPTLWDSLAARSPAPAVPAQLPPDLPDFTGHAALVARLVRVLRNPGSGVLLGIDGPAGVGKSSLAVHVAHLVRDVYPGGQIYLDLSAVDGFRATLAAVLRAFGVADQDHPDTHRGRMDLWRRLIAGRRALIVLDQADERDDIGMLFPLRPAGGVWAGSMVVVTARAPIASLGAGRWHRLLPLSPDEGLALLERIAGPERVRAEPEAAGQLLAAGGYLPSRIRQVAGLLANRPAWSVAMLLSSSVLADDEAAADDAACCAAPLG